MLFGRDLRKSDVPYTRSNEVDGRVTFDHDLAKDKQIREVLNGLAGHPIRLLNLLGKFEARYLLCVPHVLSCICPYMRSKYSVN